MFINKSYRVKFKRIVWVDIVVDAFNKEDAMDKASEQAEWDDQTHTSPEDSDFDVEEVNCND